MQYQRSPAVLCQLSEEQQQEKRQNRFEPDLPAVVPQWNIRAVHISRYRFHSDEEIQEWVKL